MGRSNFSRIGYGMTEYEAERDAIQEAERESGHQEGYSGDMNCATETHSKRLVKPRPAKTCKVNRIANKGTRKWETVFVISEKWPARSGVNTVVVNTTQGDAVKRARELALKHNASLEITIDKRLVSGNSKIAEVAPNKSQMGKWKFWGEARC